MSAIAPILDRSCGAHRCPRAEARADPLRKPPRDYVRYTAWPAAQCDVLEPDNPADSLLGVTRPVGSLKHPCDADRRTLVVTVYEDWPGFEVQAIPFRLPGSLTTVWLQHELL